MTKQLRSKTTLIATAIVFASFNAFTWSGQAPVNANGSPVSNGNTCANPSCHSGPSVSDQTISITTDIPATGFLDNTDYNITITADRGTSTASTSGFSVSVESSSMSEGTLSLGTSSNTKLVGMNTFATHNGDQGFTNGQSVWTFKWNSGSNTPDGTKIYAAVNFANNNGTTTGDVIATNNLTLMKDGANISVVENSLDGIKMYPNPAKNVLRFDNPAQLNLSIAIFDLNGRLIQNASSSNNNLNNIDISEISKGTYIVQMSSESDIKRQKLIIQ